jgi:DNA-binding GntR family transcriptional regulator
MLTSEHVYVQLRDLILSQELKYGQLVNENELTKKLGVSRTPVREALKKLETKKLVKIIPHRGAFVLGINDKSIEEIFMIRQSLEGTCGYIASSIISDSNLNLIDERLKEAENFCDEGKLAEAAEVGKYIHEMIINIVGNERIIEILNDFGESLQSLDKIAINIEGRVSRSNKEHRAILTALKNRNPEEVRKCIEKHIQSTKDDLIICFRNSQRIV